LAIERETGKDVPRAAYTGYAEVYPEETSYAVLEESEDVPSFPSLVSHLSA
jgi:hypothetical protein